MSAKTSFKSQSASHIASYDLVKSTLDFFLSVSVLNYVFQQVVSVLNYVNTNVIAQFAPLHQFLVGVDSNFDRIVLSRVDAVVAQLPDVSAYYPATVYANVVTYINTHLLRPVNHFVYNTYDAYLPATLSDNKAAFKLDDATNNSGSVFDEVNSFVNIVLEFFKRGRIFLHNKSNDASNTLVSTYNSEFDKLGSQGNYYFKSGQASYKTGVTLLNDVNASVIQPLTKHTQGYVSDVANNTKSRADSLIKDAKHGFSVHVEPKLDQVKEQQQELLNGGAPVSASA